MKMTPEKFEEIRKILLTIPEHLEEKRRKREERAAFVEYVFGDAWRTLQEKMEKYRKEKEEEKEKEYLNSIKE